MIQLLHDQQYEQVAQLLDSLRAQAEQNDNPSLAQILAAAHQICLTCRQYHAEIKSQQQAYEESVQRAHDIQQQLVSILEMVDGGTPPDSAAESAVPRLTDPSRPPSEQGSPKPRQSNNWWQRIQEVLGWKAAPPDFAAEAPPTPIEPSTVISMRDLDAETEIPIASSIEPEPAQAPEQETEKPITSPIEPEPADQEPENEQNRPSLAVYCLGIFRVYLDDQLIADWNGLKGQLVFKYLIAHAGKLITKDVLMDAFWPDADLEAARRNLHQAIYSLRQVLKKKNPDFQHIRFKNDCYLLNPEMRIWVDCNEFKKHVRVGQRLEADGEIAQAMTEYGVAEGLYQSDFLEEDMYEEWTIPQREQMRRLYLDITNRLSAYYVKQGEYTAAIALCQKTLAQDNCYEDAHLRLMQCYLAQNQRHLAVRQYHTCLQVLKEELDIAPSEEMTTLYQRIANI